MECFIELPPAGTTLAAHIRRCPEARLCLPSTNFSGKLKLLAAPKTFATFLRTLFRQDWVVYCKPPFGGPEHVLNYLGSYTHRIAISNHRLLAFDPHQVSFRWRDSAQGNPQRTLTLSAMEFLRRCLLHVLPYRFIRIRHYGFLSNRRCAAVPNSLQRN
jgi:hypothetical protein